MSSQHLYPQRLSISGSHAIISALRVEMSTVSLVACSGVLSRGQLMRFSWRWPFSSRDAMRVEQQRDAARRWIYGTMTRGRWYAMIQLLCSAMIPRRTFGTGGHGQQHSCRRSAGTSGLHSGVVYRCVARGLLNRYRRLTRQCSSSRILNRVRGGRAISKVILERNRGEIRRRRSSEGSGHSHSSTCRRHNTLRGHDGQ